MTAANAATYVDMPVRIYPILAPALDVHQTYTTNTPVENGSDAAWSQILSEIDALRVAEGSSQSYVGVVRVTYNSGIVGIAYIGRPTSVVWDDSTTRSLFWAHELGHTYGREHAPACGADFPDPNYPYPGATIGVYGTDATVTPPVLYPPSFHDIMSYCDDAWISDYTYKGVLNFVATSQATGVGGVTAPALDADLGEDPKRRTVSRAGVRARCASGAAEHGGGVPGPGCGQGRSGAVLSGIRPDDCRRSARRQRQPLRVRGSDVRRRAEPPRRPPSDRPRPAVRPDRDDAHHTGRCSGGAAGSGPLVAGSGGGHHLGHAGGAPGHGPGSRYRSDPVYRTAGKSRGPFRIGLRLDPVRMGSAARCSG